VERKQNEKELIPERKIRLRQAATGWRAEGQQPDHWDFALFFGQPLQDHQAPPSKHGSSNAMTSAGQADAVPFARCKGKKSTTGRRAWRFLQEGLHFIKLIFFSDIQLSKGQKTLQYSSPALDGEAGVSPDQLNNRLRAAAGAAPISTRFAISRCFHQQEQETLKTCE